DDPPHLIPVKEWETEEFWSSLRIRAGEHQGNSRKKQQPVPMCAARFHAWHSKSLVSGGKQFTFRRIPETIPFDFRERCERMLFTAAVSFCVIVNIFDVDAAHKERIGYKRAMAAPGNGFSTHNHRLRMRTMHQQLFNRRGKIWTLH